jgi:transcriptional regulator with XRE-family HTH domain
MLTPEEVGQRIREARLARGWTHEELARRVGVNWRTVQRWQKGNPPRLAKLVELADLFGLPHAYFVEPEDSLATLNDLRKDCLQSSTSAENRAASGVMCPV